MLSKEPEEKTTTDNLTSTICLSMTCGQVLNLNRVRNPNPLTLMTHLYSTVQYSTFCISTVFRSFMIMCGMIGLFYLVSINQLLMPQKLRNQSLMFLTFGVLCLALRFEFPSGLTRLSGHVYSQNRVEGTQVNDLNSNKVLQNWQ